MLGFFESADNGPLVFFNSWLSKAMHLSAGLSLFIAVVFREDFVAQNVYFNHLSNFVGNIVPAIFRLASMTKFPAITAAIFSINWLFVPVYFVLFFMVSRFWNEAYMDLVFSKFKKKPFLAFVVTPLFLSYFALADFGLFKYDYGMYSLEGFQKLDYVYQTHLLLSHPIGTAFYVWGLCFLEAISYMFIISTVGALTFYLVRKLHRVMAPIL